jgi:hypothetical protein
MPLARFYTTAVRVFHRRVTSSESREIAILVRPMATRSLRELAAGNVLRPRGGPG